MIAHGEAKSFEADGGAGPVLAPRSRRIHRARLGIRRRRARDRARAKVRPTKDHACPRRSYRQSARVTILLNKPIGFVRDNRTRYKPAVTLVTPDTLWKADRSGCASSRAPEKPGARRSARHRFDGPSRPHAGRPRRAAVDRRDSEIAKIPRPRPGRLSEKNLGCSTTVSVRRRALKRASVTCQNRDQLRFVLQEGKTPDPPDVRAGRPRSDGLKRVVSAGPLGELPSGSGVTSGRRAFLAVLRLHCHG